MFFKCFLLVLTKFLFWQEDWALGYKVKIGIAPEITKDIFELQNPSYNLRSSCNQFRRENMKTVHYGLQSVRYIGPKIRELVPNNIKYSDSLSIFLKHCNIWSVGVI